jgi:hypothetical protein
VAKLSVLCIPAFFVLSASLALGQNDNPETVVWFHPNQEVRVRDLPALAATDSSALLATALETAIDDKTVCCGKNSALENIDLSDSQSLKELGFKLSGDYRLSDSQPIVVKAAYVPQNALNSGLIIGNLLEQHASLVQWKSHVYVLYGAIFNDTRYSSGRRQYAIVKLLLLDPRFSDQRRETEFNRETDDWSAVEGALTLSVVRQ